MDRIAKATLEIGRRLRSARQGAVLTLAETAAKAGVSEGFLSKLERGQTAASIANLIQLTEALGLGLHELFAADDTSARTRVVVHRGEAGKLEEVAATGYSWRHLGGGAPLDRMEVFHLVFPREHGMQTMVSHPGQEHCYVLAGETGKMLFHPDPHFEGEFRTETGGNILIVQYPGPTTGERPIYSGRFNMTERKPVEAERVDL